MAAPRVSQLIDVGYDVLTTAIAAATGYVTAQLGNVVSSRTASNAAEYFYPPGFIGRPAVPTSGSKAAQVVTLPRSDNDAIIGQRDERDAAITKQCGDGETIVYSPTGKASAYFKKDGSLVISNGAASMTMTFAVNGNVTVSTNGVMAVGSQSAQALAFASAVQSVIAAVQTLAAGNCVNGAVLTSSAAAIAQLQAIAQVATQNFTSS